MLASRGSDPAIGKLLERPIFEDRMHVDRRQVRCWKELDVEASSKFHLS